MSNALPVHIFDESRADDFVPNPAFSKMAIRLDPPEVDGVTTIRTSFGVQVFRGSFYLVADDGGSYGAAQREFELAHTEREPNIWVKSEPVMAYLVDAPCVVETLIERRVEVSRTSSAGDWIVRQQSGEVMVLGAAEFDIRYLPA